MSDAKVEGGQDFVPHRMIRIDDYEAHPKNYNEHPEEQVLEIAASLQQFGQVKGVVVWRKWFVAGHGVVMAAKLIGWRELKAEVLPDEWPEYKALAYLAADNELAKGANPNLTGLARLAAEVAEKDPVMARLAAGSEERLADLMDHLNNPTPEEELEAEGLEDETTPEVSDGTLLQLVDVTIAEPRHKVKKGEVWNVGPHLLVVADVLTGWPNWVYYLDDPEGVIFAPYAGPFVPLTIRAEKVKRVVMVQPDHYVAGHILDRYEDVKGVGSVSLEESGDD